MRFSLAPLAILWCAALAGWLLQGTLAPVDEGTATRVGLLPPLGWLVMGLVIATAVGFLARPSLARVLPLILTIAVVAPWLPVPLPTVVLAVTGPAAAVAAAGIVMAWVAGTCRAPVQAPGRLSDPGRATLAAGVMAAVLFGAAAWRAAPMFPGGDEPHYLVATQSLLYDRDLKVENNYERGDYRQFVNMELRPHYLRRGQDGEIYSVHLPGVSALVLPAFALAGYAGVVVFLILLTACGTALAWRLAWTVTGSPGSAWFGWACVVLSAPVVFHSFAVYPDGPAGVLLLVGVWALLRAASPPHGATGTAAWFWVFSGTALAVLPWLHSRLAVLSAVLGAAVLWHIVRGSGAVRNAVAFLAVPAVAAPAWFAYFYVLYGEWSPAASYGNIGDRSPAFMSSGIGGLFLDHQFGLLPNAPVYLVCLAGLALMLATRRPPLLDRPTVRWLAAVLGVMTAAYVLAITPTRMWWAGWSPPARFVVPLLLSLAVPAAVAWHSARLATTRAVMSTALAATAMMTMCLVWVQRGRLAFNVRDTYGLFLEWLSPLVVLAEGAPSFHRQPEHHGFYHGAVWLAALLVAWAVVRRLEIAGWIRTRAAVAMTVPLALGLAIMTAVTVVWMLTGSAGVMAAPAQAELLRRVEPESRQVGVAYRPFGRVAPGDLPGRLRIRPSGRWLTGGDPPLFALAGPVPAGSYALDVELAPGPDSLLTLGIGHEWFPLMEFALPGHGPPASVLPLDLPVDVRAIVVRGDEVAGARIAGIALRPESVLPRRLRPSPEYARQAVRYAGGDVYFLDESAFAEPDAFWVRGSRTAEVVFVPRRSGVAARLMLRNAPVENRVTLRSAGWVLDLDMEPGEVRQIEVPLKPSPTPPASVTIGSTAGFSPALVDPASRDQRWLGVWVALP